MLVKFRQNHIPLGLLKCKHVKLSIYRHYLACFSAFARSHKKVAKNYYVYANHTLHNICHQIQHSNYSTSMPAV